jgi:hypothetical protein
MPVARIISSSFEDALQFADYLRPLFDTVEIAQPGRASDTAVDLEVNLELCTPEQAWQQIADLSRQPDSEIFVAPGALFCEAGSEQQELNAGMELAPLSEPSSPSFAAAPPQELDHAGCEVEAAIAQASAAAVKAAGSNGSGTHKSHSEPIPEHELNWLGRSRESLRQWLAVRALLREIRMMQQQEVARQQQRQRQMALQFERERRERETQQLAALRAAAPLVEPVAAEPQLQLSDESAQADALLQRRAQEQRQAEQEEAVRRGRFVEAILRRRAEEQSAQAQQQAGPDSEAPPVEFEVVPAESFAPAAPSAPSLRFTASRRPDRLRPAMALAGITSMLLTAVLVGYAHRRPASPVPLSVLQRSTTVEQTVPFGPAVLPAPAEMPAATSPASPPETILAAAPLPERHTFRSDFRRVRVDPHEVDYLANDVTVRHFNYQMRRTPVRHPATAVPISASTRGVKQISDME